MRDNSKDTTIWRNYREKYLFLIKEYEQVKRKEHPVYKQAQDFYKAHDTCGKTFLKYSIGISKAVKTETYYHANGVRSIRPAVLLSSLKIR